MPIDLRLEAGEVALCTDLYELTVSAAFFEHSMNEQAAFEMALRRMPPNRGYMIAAGVERLLEALEAYHFDAAAIAYLETLKIFKPAFLDYLAGFRFSGEVRALPEGTIFFAGEPILEIHAPLIEGQIVETLALNQVGFATMAATKAARCVRAAQGSARDRLRRAARAGRGRGPDRGAIELPCRLRRDRQRPRGAALRNSGVRHDEPQLRDGA